MVVVAYNEAANIERCIRSVQAVNYPKNAFEIIVVDGCSEDRTQELVRKLAAEDKRIRLFENPDRVIASNRNMGIQKARHLYIAFTDADCEVPANWLSDLVSAFLKYSSENSGLAAVGGANIPPQESATRFMKALGLMLNTFLGSLGSVQGRVFNAPRRVPSLACLNVLYDKIKLESVGLFDPDMKNIGEDAELNCRLRQAGYYLLYIPGVAVLHRLRPTLKTWARNMFQYGRGRIVMSRKHPELLHFQYRLPFLFLGIFSLVLASPWIGWPGFLPLSYFPVLFIYSAGVAVKNHQPGLAGSLFAAFAITHWSYSLGMLRQFTAGKPAV